jgi:WD40 repeat protein
MSTSATVVSAKFSDDIRKLLLRCSTTNASQADETERGKAELEQSAVESDAVRIFVIDTSDGRVTALSEDNEVNAIEMSRDGQTAFLGTTKGTLQIVSVSEPNKTSTVTIQKSPIQALCLHPDGKRLAILTEEETSLWTLGTNQMVLNIKNQELDQPVDVLPYRGDWNPFTAGPEAIQRFGNRGVAIPSDPVSFLHTHLPRPLSSSEVISFRTEHAKTVLFGPDQ